MKESVTPTHFKYVSEAFVPGIGSRGQVVFGKTNKLNPYKKWI